MGGGIGKLDRAVARRGDDFTVVDDDRAHRHFAARRGRFGLCEGGIQEDLDFRLAYHDDRHYHHDMTEKAIEDKQGGERIAKRLSRAGVCSRRDAEKLIAEGRVTLNGAVLSTPATIVTDADHILVDGKPVGEAEPARLFRYHKPHGLVTTRRDEKGRQTIFDQMPAGLPRLMSIGRLDLTSEGLMLLTNDGDMARHLELPSTGWMRRYRVRAFGRVDAGALERLKRGITVEGVRYGPIEAELENTQGANSWLNVGLQEGRNREIRRVFEHMGLTVNRLIRVAYGPFQLGKLPEGAVEEVPRRVVREQLGDVLKL